MEISVGRLTSANLTWHNASDSACNVLVIAAGRIAQRFLPMHTNAEGERELTDASLRGCSPELYYPWGAPLPCLRLPYPCLPNLGLPPHKAGIPSLCNDKLGVRFVKANWMRLLTYTYRVSYAILEIYRFASMHARARARTLAIH